MKSRIYFRNTHPSNVAVGVLVSITLLCVLCVTEASLWTSIWNTDEWLLPILAVLSC